MTTVAYCPTALTLVTDSMATSDESGESYAVTKAWKIGDHVYAAAGDYGDLLTVVEWLRAGRPKSKPKLKDDFSGLWIRRDNGSYQCFYQKLRMTPGRYATAIGTGAQFAIGAMDAGASVIRAVEIACHRDEKSGGRLRIINFPC